MRGQQCASKISSSRGTNANNIATRSVRPAIRPGPIATNAHFSTKWKTKSVWLKAAPYNSLAEWECCWIWSGVGVKTLLLAVDDLWLYNSHSQQYDGTAAIHSLRDYRLYLEKAVGDSRARKCQRNSGDFDWCCQKIQPSLQQSLSGQAKKEQFVHLLHPRLFCVLRTCNSLASVPILQNLLLPV